MVAMDAPHNTGWPGGEPGGELSIKNSPSDDSPPRSPDLNGSSPLGGAEMQGSSTGKIQGPQSTLSRSHQSETREARRSAGTVRSMRATLLWDDHRCNVLHPSPWPFAARRNKTPTGAGPQRGSLAGPSVVLHHPPAGCM